VEGVAALINGLMRQHDTDMPTRFCLTCSLNTEGTIFKSVAEVGEKSGQRKKRHCRRWLQEINDVPPVSSYGDQGGVIVCREVFERRWLPHLSDIILIHLYKINFSTFREWTEQ
jgi:hypothetical protein